MCRGEERKKGGKNRSEMERKNRSHTEGRGWQKQIMTAERWKGKKRRKGNENAISGKRLEEQIERKLKMQKKRRKDERAGETGSV